MAKRGSFASLGLAGWLVNRLAELPRSARPCYIYYPMTLTTDEVQRLAGLARLRLTEDEIKHFGQQMSSILDYVSELQAVDTSAISVKPLMAAGNLRRDVPDQAMIQSALLANLPERLDDYVRVKAVFDHD